MHLFLEHDIQEHCQVDFLDFITIYEAINHDMWHLYSLNQTTKEGDVIIVKLNNLDLGYDDELDIHLTGTRFPFLIRRDYFWILVFIISLVLILSPIWTSFLPGKK